MCPNLLNLMEAGQVFISGGGRQGLKTGDTLRVMAPGQKVRSKQTGMEISLPASQVATIKVVSFFGDSENDEGSVCEIITGTVDPSAADLFVEEVKP